MITADFQFDPLLHQYVVNNQLQPHVTGILEQYGLIDYTGVPARTLERKQLIGTLVHKITHWMDEDGLALEFAVGAIADEHAEEMSLLDVVVEDLRGYAFAWKKFLVESQFQCLPGYVERRHVAQVNGMMYGMTIDRAGIFRRLPTILDLKCTHAREASWPLQLAGYALGLPRPDSVVRWERANVWLKPDRNYMLFPSGRMKKDPILEKRDEEVFLAALRLTHWKRENL